MGETINAVIWLCDLRGFTSLSERLERDLLIETLNQYFGPMCDAVENAGGEVLKFIGDAMLAIFPVADAPGPACRLALAAAATARAALEETNRNRTAGGLPAIAYGLALHVGEVLYGNIGGESRLDFTVIGPAVNLTARIESLCGELKRELLLSADFVVTAGIPADEVSEFELHGVGERQRVFAPREPD
jgi:adenylate cyclase